MPTSFRVLFSNLVAIGIASLSIWVVSSFGVNFLYYDEWDFFPVFEKFFDGTLTLKDLLAQHTESRMLFPRLIVLGLGLLSSWNVVWEMYLIQTIQVVIALLTISLIKKNDHLSKAQLASYSAAASLALFSLSQWRNFITSFQLVMYLPSLWLILGLYLSGRTDSVKRRVIICALASLFATVSFANGLILWVVFPIFLFFSLPRSTKTALYTLAFWGVAAGLTFAFYFWGFQNPSSHPSTSALLNDPIKVVTIFFRLIALPFSCEALGEKAQTLLGASALLAFIALFVAKVFNIASWNRISPWLAIGAYGFGTLLIIANGRADFGEQAALAPRYNAFSIYCWLALLGMLSTFEKSKAIQSLALLTFALVLPLYTLASLESLPKLRIERESRVHGKLAVQMLNIAWNHRVGDLTRPDGAKLLRDAQILAEWGYGPKLLRREKIRFIEDKPSPSPLIAFSSFSNSIRSNNLVGVSAKGLFDSNFKNYLDYVVLVTTKKEKKARKYSHYYFLHRGKNSKIGWRANFQKLKSESEEYWLLEPSSGNAYALKTKGSVSVLSEIGDRLLLEQDSSITQGAFEPVATIIPTWSKLSGWLSPTVGDAVGIIETCENEDPSLKATAFTGKRRLDTVAMFGEEFKYSGWEIALPSNVFKNEASCRLHAVALSSENKLEQIQTFGQQTFPE